MDFIGAVFNHCYLFLIQNTIFGYSLWSIFFDIFIVTSIIAVLRMTARKGDEE